MALPNHHNRVHLPDTLGLPLVEMEEKPHARDAFRQCRRYCLDNFAIC